MAFEQLFAQALARRGFAPQPTVPAPAPPPPVAQPVAQPFQQAVNLAQFLGTNSTQGSLGAQAVNRALQSGLTAQQIQNQAAAQGLSIGSAAQQQLAIAPMQQARPVQNVQPVQMMQPVQNAGNLAQFAGTNSTPGVLGAQAISRALSSGLTAQQIQNQAASQGLSIANNAQQQLKAVPAQPVQNAVQLSQFLGTNSTPGVLGAQAFNRAVESGLTPDQVKSLASTQGLSIGTAAQAMNPVTEMNTPKFDKNISLGQNLKAAGDTLSEKELNRLAKITGKSEEKILEKAVEKGLSIGSKVVNQFSAQNSILPEAFQGVTTKGQVINFDPFLQSPILQKINNAPKLDKGSKLFIGSSGSTSTVLPRGPMSTGERVRTPAQTQDVVQNNTLSAPAAPAQAPAITGDMAVDNFLNQLAQTAEEPMMAAMPPLESFEDVSSAVDIKDPLQFASLGQSYLTEAIRAARRRSQSRRDYMRDLMMSGLMPNINRLMIGGGVNVG